jgi:hypothetical protein
VAKPFTTSFFNHHCLRYIEKDASHRVRFLIPSDIHKFQAIYLTPGCAMVRFEPYSDNAHSPGLVALRILQIIEPIKYAFADDKGGTILEGSLLPDHKTGKDFTFKLRAKKYGGLSLLLSDLDSGLSFLFTL